MPVRRLALFTMLVHWVGSCAGLSCAQESKSLRVYFIGNSVTDTINYGGLEKLAAARGYRLVWGRDTIPGAPLEWIWEHPLQGFQQVPFGYFPQALTEHSWDVLCLQPFDRHIEGNKGDLAMVRKFVAMALPKSPNLQVYVYARWPRRDQDGALDYGRQWLRKYTGGWDNSNETKDYFERLVAELRRALPGLKKPVLMVPVGHVMHELDRRMRAGQMSGISRIDQVYRDQIHLDHVGRYIVACTFFATFYGQDPTGLPTEPYGSMDPDLAKVIQETAWSIVSTHALSGVVAQLPVEQSPVATGTPVAPEMKTSPAPSPPKPQPLSRDQRYRQLVVGTWEDDYQGKRTMVLKPDGTGTMLVELSGMQAALFAAPAV